MKFFSHRPILAKAALELGHITIAWSMLEDIIGSFMAHLLGVDSASDSAAILDGNMDIRSKIHATKGLAFLRHFDEEWLRTTLTLLDHVDNNLRNRRNAITHAIGSRHGTTASYSVIVGQESCVLSPFD